MPETRLYGILESMIDSAKKADAQSVDKLNHGFSQGYDKLFCDVPYYGKDTRPLHYDRCRNLAHSLSRLTSEHEFYASLLEEIKTHFEAITKPKN